MPQPKSILLTCFLTVFTFTMLDHPCPAQDDPTPVQIIDLYINALGGMEKLNSVNALSTSATIEMPNNQGTTTVTTMNQLQSGDNFLLTIEIPDVGTVTRGSDGETYWIIDPINGAAILEGEQREATRKQFNTTFPVLEWKSEFKGEITYGGTEEVDGQTCYKLIFRPAEGADIIRYIQKESGYLTKVETSQPSRLGQMTVQVYSSDFKKIDGIVMPHLQTTSTAIGDTVMTIKEFKVNPEFPADTFDIPAEIRKLLEKK